MVGFVRGLELTGFAIKHGLLYPLDNLFAEQALRSEQEENKSEHIGEPRFNTAAKQSASVNFKNLLTDPDDQAINDRTRN